MPRVRTLPSAANAQRPPLRPPNPGLRSWLPMRSLRALSNPQVLHVTLLLLYVAQLFEGYRCEASREVG